MSKLTLDPAIRKQINEILAPLKNPEAWEKMGIPFAPTPHAIVRLEGPAGCGKSVTADYMARQISGRQPIRLEFGNTANHEFGSTEKAIASKFVDATTQDTPCIIMEEAESLLISREKLDIMRDSHMLGLVDTMLVNIDRFIARKVPSLLIITTNLPELLDPAIESRITDVIKLFPPVGLHARKLWDSKLPAYVENCYPECLDKLAELGATPRQMEKAILKICRKALLENRLPRFEDFELNQ